MGSYFTDSSLEDVIGFANDLHGLVLITDADEAIEATAPLLWDVAWTLRNKDAVPGPEPREAFGTLLALRAILAQPQMLELAAQRLCARLSELLQVDAAAGDREVIAAVGKAQAPAEAHAVRLAADHRVDGAMFRINAAGRLTIEREGHRGMVELEPCEVFALAQYLRMPGVSDIINEADRHTQNEEELHYQTQEEASSR